MKNAITSFTNPFEVDNKEELFCLASGKPALRNVREGLLQAHDRGQQLMEEFITSRLLDKTVPFHEPLKRLKHLLWHTVELAMSTRLCLL